MSELYDDELYDDELYDDELYDDELYDDELYDDELYDDNILYSELSNYETSPIRVNYGYIILKTIKNDYIRLIIQYKDLYMKIKYDFDDCNMFFIIVKNNMTKYMNFDNLQEYLLEELEKIDENLFFNINKKIFIDMIKDWFNEYNLLNDVFI
jgi:hypothetical protein